MKAKVATWKAETSTLLHQLTHYFPIFGWLRAYQRDGLRMDVIAGVTVWGLMVPAAMGYAQVAGVPAQMGLYAAMAGSFLYPIFGTSRQLKVSTSSTPAIMSATIVTALAAGDSSQFIPLSIALALATGALFLVAGIIRLGFLADFMSKSVISGFIFGLAIVIIVGQVPKLLGVPTTDGNVFQQIIGIIQELGQTNPWTLALGAGALGLIFFLKRRYPKWPAALVALVLGILVVTVFNLDSKGVAIVGLVPAGLPTLGFPENISFSQLVDLLPAAAAMVVVLFGESIGSARTFATKYRYEIDADQELIALGAANIGSSFVQGIAIDASLSNSAAADNAGAKTQLASIVAAALILITVIALMPLFQNLPQAVLGAIVISSVVGLLDVAELKRIYSLRKSDFWLAMVSMFGVLAIGVLGGLMIAVLLSLVIVLYRASRPNGAVLGKVPGRPVYGDIAHNPDYQLIPGLLIYRLDAALFFANASLVRNQLRDLVRKYAPRAVLFDLAATYNLDVASIDMLEELLVDSREANIELMFAQVKAPVRAMFDRAGLTDRIGAGRIHPNVEEAVKDFLQPSAPAPVPAPSPTRSGTSPPPETASAPQAPPVDATADNPDGKISSG